MTWSWLNRPSRPKANARRRAGKTFLSFVPEVVPLEDRCLLSSSILGFETPVNARPAGEQSLGASAHRSMDVASDGTAVVAWVDNSLGIVARRMGIDGRPLGDDFQVGSTGVSGNANVAIHRPASAQETERIVIVWSSRGSGGTDVFARTFTADGTPLTAVFQVNASTAGDHGDAAVEWISADRFVVTWTGAGQGDNQTVLARIFNFSGQAATGEIRVPEAKTGPQRESAVVALPNGGFQVAWSGRGPNDTSGIFSRQFTSAGQKVGTLEFRVNTATQFTEWSPTLARTGDQVVVAWRTTNTSIDPSGSGIAARRLTLNGSGLGDVFRVNETTAGQQADPSIAAMAGGSFVVAWRSSNAGTDGIYQREFLAEGTPLLGERQVNTTQDGSQTSPTVRSQGPDGYVVVWDGAIGGDTAGIGMQRYGDPLMPAITSANGMVEDDKHPGFFFPEVLYLDPSVPVKTITLMNTSNLTIYPILEDANSNQLSEGNKSGLPTFIGLYDPYDAVNQEYRGYVGYKDEGTGQFFLGLRPGESFTFQVPLVFWDAGRLHITTDAHYMITPTGQTLPFPNPYSYYDVDPYQGNPQTFAGNIQLVDGKPTNTLTLVGDQLAKLKVGQSVASDGNDLPDGTTITALEAGQNSTTIVHLSQAARLAGGTHNYTFYKPTARFMQDSSIDGSLGRIMWYHARAKDSGDAEGIGLDAPTQLTEFTIRDPFMGDTTFKTHLDIANSEKITLVNYDVSYVDSMVLSVAMEATDVQVYPLQQYQGKIDLNNGQPTDRVVLNLPFDARLLVAGMLVTSTTGDLPHGTLVVSAEAGPNQTTIVHLSKVGNPNAGGPSFYSFTRPQPTRPYGWIGAQQTFAQMQEIIKRFTSDTPANGLGDYFDGHGYPEFYNPDTSLSGIKLPSGQNLPLLSPLKGLGSKSHFDNDQYIVTSNGTGLNRLTAGGNDGPGPNQIYINFPNTMSIKQRNDFLKQLDQSKAVWQVTADGTIDLPKILKVGALDNNGRAVVTLSGPTGLAEKGYSFAFTRPVTDYASTRLASIWYSWAQFYVKTITERFPSFQPVQLHGTIATVDEDGVAKPTNELSVDGDVRSRLALGMVVETDGGNFPTPSPGDPITRTTILDMKFDAASNKTIIYLSKRPTGVGGPAVTYTFKLPVALTPADPGVTLMNLSFTKNAADAVLFAQTTYQVMEAMCTIPLLPDQGFDWLQVLANCIGGNIGFIKNIGVSPNAKDGSKFTGYAGIAVDIRDKIKSVLRGVWNFNVVPETSGNWYPDPALKGGAQGTGQMIDGKAAAYNVLNLDPFVWFVHKQLGLSGYGFSLDDDVADVGANGATKLSMNAGGIAGLPQLSEWTWGAPFGAVQSATGKIGTYDAPGSEFNGYSTITMLDSLPFPIALLLNGFDKNVGPGALVIGPGIPPGTRVVLVIPPENTVVLSTKDATVGAAGAYKFTGIPPTVRTPAAASQVANKSAKLSVLGADSHFGEAALTYAWSLLNGPGTAAFTVNGSNAAKNTKVTVSLSGTYTFRATIADPDGFFVTSDVTVAL